MKFYIEKLACFMQQIDSYCGNFEPNFGYFQFNC